MRIQTKKRRNSFVETMCFQIQLFAQKKNRLLLLRERETHTQQVTYLRFFIFRELVFFPFSSDVYRGQKEQTKKNDYIHNGA